MATKNAGTFLNLSESVTLLLFFFAFAAVGAPRATIPRTAAPLPPPVVVVVRARSAAARRAAEAQGLHADHQRYYGGAAHGCERP